MPFVSVRAAITLALCLLGVSSAHAQADWTLKTVDGASTTLRQFRGKVVVLNFWATWCPPCRTEIPLLMKLQATYGPGRVVVLGIAMDEKGLKTVAPYVQHERFVLDHVMRPLNYPVLIGTDAVGDAYRVDGLPMTVIVDGAGREVRRIESAIEFDDVDHSIRSMLVGKSGQ
jgi:thiol-disulfide isomerase/thioredoxin